MLEYARLFHAGTERRTCSGPCGRTGRPRRPSTLITATESATSVCLWHLCVHRRARPRQSRRGCVGMRAHGPVTTSAPERPCSPCRRPPSQRGGSSCLQFQRLSRGRGLAPYDPLPLARAPHFQCLSCCWQRSCGLVHGHLPARPAPELPHPAVQGRRRQASRVRSSHSRVSSPGCRCGPPRGCSM